MRRVSIAEPSFAYDADDPGAHQIRNDTDSPVRVLMWSEVVVPTATVYPDSDKVGIWTGNKEDDVLVERSSAVGYFHGERG